jgi:hypothetical protein
MPDYQVNLDLDGGWFGAASARAFVQIQRFSGKTVILIGEVPYAQDDIAGLLPPQCTVHQDDVPTNICADYIVIGQRAADTSKLDNCLQYACTDTRFVPQDGFLDDFLFGLRGTKAD